MNEQDTIAGVDAISLSVIYGYPICVHLSNGVRASRVKMRFFGLGGLNGTISFRS